MTTNNRWAHIQCLILSQDCGFVVDPEFEGSNGLPPFIEEGYNRSRPDFASLPPIRRGRPTSPTQLADQMTQPLYEQLLRSYFGKKAALYTKTPSGRGVVGHVHNGTGQLCCICKTEILFYLNGAYQDKKVTSFLRSSTNLLRQSSLLVGSDAVGINPFVGDLSSIAVAARRWRDA